MWNQGGYSDSSMAVGGYTQSPGGFASPSMSQGGEKKSRTRASQIIPCTVSQLMSASQVDEVFKVGEVEVSQVTIVGVIRITDKSMTNIQYKVDDMTSAPMDVKQWVDTEDPSVDGSVLPPNTYVKISGNLRSFQNHRSVVAFSVRPVEDMNEITSHMLEVVQAHMALSKDQNSGNYMSSVSRPVTSSSMDTSYMGAHDTVNNGLSANQNQVLSFIKSCQDPLGVTLQDLRTRLSHISLPALKQVLEFLGNEGHVFSTIDEDHYKSTDYGM
ncbi:replication protein A 32 kDa subunit [Corythoichthys intestinalis]|uniref:replication protein A 32 kDa subunit n=1 Tax=Corythoichthys intestinalis TaxID=161448 RepID=UPI0025A5AB9C|nr:replication protein A 32 kDa subunit [Corythoichthys intestinalis]XP_061789151.1 replication protein A 32 kDa subunit-like [Nerophis lumbriciformis]